MTSELPTKIGSYRIVGKLGEGDMGVVWEGVTADEKLRVAIKTLRPDPDKEWITETRLLMEARIPCLIEHPGIVRVFDFGRDSNGRGYFVMELLRGETLGQRIKACGTIEPGQAVNLAHQVASALAAAHAMDIVHRDVEPENIMLVPDPVRPGRERTKLLDFGVARLMSPNDGPHLKGVGLIVGTPLTISPEQCVGSFDVDDRTDVYSLGVVLYWMLAGKPPFSAADIGELLAMQIYMAPPALADIAPSVPQPLVQLVHRMLKKKRDARPRMAEVVSELSSIGGVSNAVTPPTAVVRPTAVVSPTAAVPSQRLSTPTWAGIWRWLRGVKAGPP